jgi:hypothetical protein
MANPAKASQASSPRTSVNCCVAWTKRYVARTAGPELLRRSWRATGVEMRPNHSGTSAERGKPVVSPAPYTKWVEGKRTARRADGAAGKGGGRKPRPCCNGADRGCNITPRASRQTSLWSGVTREPGQQTSGDVAERSVAATPSGAVPSRGNTVCLLQAGIVKVSSGKRRRAESVRFDCPVVQLFAVGVENSPHGRPGSNGTPT